VVKVRSPKSLFLYGQSQRKHSPARLILAAANFDLTAMQFHDALNERQSKAAALDAARIGATI
jgi:hypothetical protein